MPLEALNENIYSFKSDIWAIGIIFFEMLTGKTPWRAKTENDLKRQIKGISIKNLIPVHLSGLSTHFLIKALDVNVATRMTPEEMDRHFSTNNYTQERWTASGNISGNSPVNVQNNSILFRTNVFKTRVASHER